MIDRLRTWARNGHIPKALADDLKDAADEIERLRRRSDQVVAPTQAQIEAAAKAIMKTTYPSAEAQARAALTAAAEVGNDNTAYWKRKHLQDYTIERCAQVTRDKLLSCGHVDLAEKVEAAIRALKE